MFEFYKMAFSLMVASAIFQELLMIVLQNLEVFTIAYLDHILIYSVILEEYLNI